MIKYLYILPLILVGFLPISTFSQLTTTGSAIPLAQCGCYQLTDAVGGQTGGAFSPTAINVDNDFELKFTVNFGSNDFGGEGVAFALQGGGTWLSDGQGQWGLGIQANSNSSNTFHIEFDTRYSHIECACANGDNGVDHMGIFSNAIINHSISANNLWTGLPTHPLMGGMSNVEDGEDHTVKIKYTSGSQTIEVYIDGEGTASMSQVLLQPLSFYVGGSTALWGWTGATPTATSVANKQTVCLANSPTFDYSLVNCQNVSMDFNAQTFSFNPIVSYEWYFDGVLNGNTASTVPFIFTTPGLHQVIIKTTDNTGCVGADTVEIGVGFDIVTTVSANTVCPGANVDLESEAVFFVPPTCNYILMMGDGFCDGWAGSEIEVLVDGVVFGTYTPPNVGCGGTGWLEFVDLVIPDGGVVDINFTYAGVFGGEIFYYVADPSGNVIIDVPQGTVTGDITNTFTADCGITATTYSYQWQEIGGAAGPANPLWTGVPVTFPSSDFEVMITNNNTGCIVGDTLTVSTFDTVYVDISGDATICDGTTTDLLFTFSGTPPFDLEYSVPVGPNVVVTGIATMTHTITVSDDGAYSPVSITGNGCAGNISGNSAMVTVIPLPTVNIGSNATYCAGDVMTDLTVNSANGGSVFWWVGAVNVGDTLNADGAGATFNPNGFGLTTTTSIFAQEYSIPLGCTGVSDEVILTINAVPNPPSVAGQNEYCDGDFPTALTATPLLGGAIAWYTDTTQAPVGAGTSYTPTLGAPGVQCVWVTETNSICPSDYFQFCITVKPTPTMPGITGDDAYCLSDVITPLTATPNIGGVITWSDGTIGNNFMPTQIVGATTYCANETLNGCTGPDSCYVVTFYEDPVITIPPTVAICIGDSIEICAENNGVFPPDIISWTHGPDTDCIYLGPPVDEQYIVCLTNPACGTVCDTINIVVNPLPIIVAGDDQVTGLGGEVNMWAEGGLSYVWSPSVNSCGTCDFVYVVPSQTTNYVVTGTDENGCKNTDTVTITINGEMEVFVANIFSPNNDGRNDLLLVQGPRLSQFEWMIFDRWGRKLFETTDQKQPWDGTFKGEIIPQQVVTYVVKGVDVLGREVKIGGNTMVSR